MFRGEATPAQSTRTRAEKDEGKGGTAVICFLCFGVKKMT